MVNLNATEEGRVLWMGESRRHLIAELKMALITGMLLTTKWTLASGRVLYEAIHGACIKMPVK